MLLQTRSPNGFMRDLDRLFFDDFFFAAPKRWAEPSSAPRFQIETREAELELTAELPGVTAEALTVRVEDDLLTIGAERKIAAPEGYAPRHRERAGFRFEQKFRLPFRVDAEKAVAQLKDGQFSLTLPRHASEAPRQITVKAG